MHLDGFLGFFENIKKCAAKPIIISVTEIDVNNKKDSRLKALLSLITDLFYLENRQIEIYSCKNDYLPKELLPKILIVLDEYVICRINKIKIKMFHDQHLEIKNLIKTVLEHFIDIRVLFANYI